MSDAPSQAQEPQGPRLNLPPAGELVCELCDGPISQEEISVEAFEIAGGPACTFCLEALAEQEVSE